MIKQTTLFCTLFVLSLAHTADFTDQITITPEDTFIIKTMTGKKCQKCKENIAPTVGSHIVFKGALGIPERAGAGSSHNLYKTGFWYHAACCNAKSSTRLFTVAETLDDQRAL